MDRTEKPQNARYSMVLSKEDAALFFKLWLPLLRFGSEAYDLHAGKLVKPSGVVDLQAALEVAEAIWGDVSVIDDYLSLRHDMSQEDRETIMDWKRAVHGSFALERHLRGGSVFISLENNEVYLVKGVTSRWQDMVGEQPLPVILTVTLLPFKGAIITDGLVRAERVTVGPGIRQELKDAYLDAKSSGIIRKTL